MLDLSRLSAPQREVVLAGDGPLLVVAGPGSGKTTVLAARIAYLVTARRVPPTSVLALTFATKAARELRQRLTDLLGPAGQDVDVGTFHALGLRLVRQWGEALGWRPGPITVYGADEARRLLRQAADALGLDPQRFPLRELATQLERYRLTAGATGCPPAAAPLCPTAGQLAELAERYEGLLRRRGAVDYPAMLALPLRLCAARPDALRVLQDSYRHVLCDEGQDVCRAQYDLLRYLVARHRNLSVVGDALQNLYSWRGADSRFLLGFERDFPGARVVHLDENFRATGRLVDLANALSDRVAYGRRLRTQNPRGEAARLHVAPDEQTEADFVATEIARLCADRRVRHPGEIAVLHRTKRLAHPVALALREHRLPYRMGGGADLFGRREVQDALAYLRLAHNPGDAAALARVADAPPRRLGQVAAALRGRPVPVGELPDLARRYGPAATASALTLVALVGDLHARSADLGAGPLLDFALDRSGYRPWLVAQADGAARLENLVALRALAAQAGPALGGWLAEVQLGEDVASGPEDGERVLLTTIHGAKGGEWRIVFVVGLEEGILPHRRALRPGPDGEYQAGLEEELRLAYVAVTRPRERLYLTCCRTRRRDGRSESRLPSRFLRGLPVDRIDRAA